MMELIKASAYYKRRTPGWVVLQHGYPWHFSGRTGRRDAVKAVQGEKK
jgi:hypothetical protein